MPEISMGEVFTWLAARAPDEPAVRCGDEVVTRAELDRRAAVLARRWVDDGIEHDDLVTVCLSSSIDLVVACVAAWKAGATPQPLSPSLPTGERDRLVGLGRPFVVVDAPLDDLVGEPLRAARAPASSWKVATSSGSTGAPKLIRAAAAATVDPQRHVTSFLPVAAVQLVSAPLTHGAPFVYAMRGLMTGHSLVLMPRFDPDEWLRLVREHAVTWSMLVPTTMHRIWRAPTRPTADVSSLERVLHLGAACPPDLKRAWLEWLGPDRVDEVYAGTESQGITVIGGREWLEHPGSVGRATGGSQFRVVRSDGAACDPGEPGEVLMRRATSTFSYVGAESPDRGGWHSLGDLGHLDADGYLYLAGRLDDVITRAGTPILPAPIEAALEQHPQVRSALAVARQDDDLGEVVRAVVDDAGAGLTTSDLEHWVESRLDRESRPCSWRVVDRPLRDDAGKARRRDW